MTICWRIFQKCIFSLAIFSLSLRSHANEDASFRLSGSQKKSRARYTTCKEADCIWLTLILNNEIIHHFFKHCFVLCKQGFYDGPWRHPPICLLGSPAQWRKRLRSVISVRAEGYVSHRPAAILSSLQRLGERGHAHRSKLKACMVVSFPFSTRSMYSTSSQHMSFFVALCK